MIIENDNFYSFDQIDKIFQNKECPKKVYKRIWKIRTFVKPKFKLILYNVLYNKALFKLIEQLYADVYINCSIEKVKKSELL